MLNYLGKQKQIMVNSGISEGVSNIAAERVTKFDISLYRSHSLIPLVKSWKCNSI